MDFYYIFCFISTFFLIKIYIYKSLIERNLNQNGKISQKIRVKQIFFWREGQLNLITPNINRPSPYPGKQRSGNYQFWFFWNYAVLNYEVSWIKGTFWFWFVLFHLLCFILLYFTLFLVAKINSEDHIF